VKRFALAFVILVASGAALVGLTLFRVHDDLSAGRQALQEARRALASGNLDEAADRFRRAGERFLQASKEVGGPLGTVAGLFPLLGNDVDVAAGLADAGVLLSGAGSDLTSAISGLPEGFGSLVPVGGRFPLDAYATLSQAVAEARTDVGEALDAVTSSPSSFLTGPVLEARWEAENQLRELSRTLDASVLLLDGLPGFAGQDGKRTYLVLAQNPAELRGTGGIWGAYAILTMRDGEPAFGKVAPTQSLPDLEDVPAPSEDYADNYEGFGGAASWHNMNMTPDFPSAAQAALANVEKGTGLDLDGVIAADPFALRAMLEVTGSVPVPGTGRTIGPENVVDFTTNEAYSLFRGPSERKEILGDVVKGVVARFLAIDGMGVARMKAIAEAAAGDHLLVYSEDPAFQRGLELAGAAGSFGADGPSPLPTDFVSVSVNNASGAKIDYYASRTLDYEVTLGGQGEAFASLTTTLVNSAPSSGQPRYVIGPYATGAEPGDQISFVTISCHLPCELQGAARDGQPVTLEQGTELGVPWFRDFRTVGPGGEGSLSLRWFTREVWDGNSSGGAYRLVFSGQTTLRPTSLRVTVNAPPGTDIEWTSVPMAVDGGTAVWEGALDDAFELEVRFRAPVPLAWWRNAIRML
jgi:hypothetical protein